MTRRWSLLFDPQVHASGVYLSAPIMSYGILGVLFSVSNLFIKKLWSTVILSHFNALTLLDAQHFLLLTFIKRG